MMGPGAPGRYGLATQREGAFMTTTEADSGTSGTGVLAGEDRLLIDGELAGAAGGATFDVINPATEEVAGVAADGAPADFDRAIAAARRAFDANAGNWRDDVEFRAHCVMQLRDGLVRAQERLRRILVTEIGTPIAMTYGIQLAFPIERPATGRTTRATSRSCATRAPTRAWAGRSGRSCSTSRSGWSRPSPRGTPRSTSTSPRASPPCWRGTR